MSSSLSPISFSFFARDDSHPNRPNSAQKTLWHTPTWSSSIMSLLSSSLSWGLYDYILAPSLRSKDSVLAQ
jgi:hypothetical protein